LTVFGVITDIAVGTNPFKAVIRPSSNEVWVLNSGTTNQISVVDMTNYSVPYTIDVGTSQSANDLVFLSDGSKAYFTTGGATNKIFSINGSSKAFSLVTTTPTYGVQPAVSPGNGFVYYTQNGSPADVFKINTSTEAVTTFDSVPTCPTGVAISSAGKMYVSDQCHSGSDWLYTYGSYSSSSSSNFSISSFTAGEVFISPNGSRVFASSNPNSYVLDGSSNAMLGTPGSGFIPFNNAVKLDGVNGCVNLGNAAALTYNSGIEFWIKPTTNWTSASGAKYLWNKDSDGISGHASIRYNASGTGALVFTLHNGTTTYTAQSSTGLTFDANRWYHVAATIQVSGGNKAMLHILRDGVKLGSSAQTTEPMSAWNGSTANAYLGCYNGSSNYTQALYDEYRYGVQTASARYIANYSVPNTETLPDTAYNQVIRFNESSGTTATFSTYGINATLMGGAAFSNGLGPLTGYGRFAFFADNQRVLFGSSNGTYNVYDYAQPSLLLLETLPAITGPSAGGGAAIDINNVMVLPVGGSNTVRVIQYQ
jgi:hypothetical protein